MEDQDDIPAGEEQALIDRIDDEIVNRELMERLDSTPSPHNPHTPIFESCTHAIMQM
jgi:hypothetical protein